LQRFCDETNVAEEGIGARERQFWFVVAVQTGARVSELENLQWSHVDLETGWIRLPGTKTANAWRQIPISEELMGWLDSVPRRQREGYLVQRWPNYRRDLHVACRQVGIKGISANDLRRTFCSWLLQAGQSTLVVARMMGHNSTRMVERIYGQLSMATYRDAINAMPVCTAYVPHPLSLDRTYETYETTRERKTETRNAGTQIDSGALFVPRDRIELPTRGFSVPCSTD